MRGRARLAVAAVAVLWALGSPAASFADPPGPTDYLTEVIGIEPDVAGFRVEVVGGDSFILIEAAPGVTLEVVGYRGEPYLRFLPDGTVEENQASPTTYLNIDRYGIADIPGSASADAEPSWVVVATDGSYAWHDHRAHWMNEARPPGREAGDVILEGVVPLIVDGVEVDVIVQSVWQAAPSMAPVLSGMSLALAALVAAMFLRAGPAVLAGLSLALAAAAAVAGISAVVSVPAETAPPWSLWAPPVAAAALGASAVLGRWVAPMRRWAASAALLGSLLLLIWGIVHREWMWRAVLPTGAPFWLDRLVTGAVLVGALGLLALIGRAQVAGEDR